MSNTDNEYSKNSIFSIWRYGGSCGILLLSRPLLYFLFSRKRSLNEYASVDTSAIIFILYSIIGFYYAYKELSNEDSVFGRLILTHSPLIMFLIYTTLGIISMAWSVNMALTGYRAFECFAYILMIVATLNRLFSYEDNNLVIKWSLLFIIVDIFFAITQVAKSQFNLSYILEASQMMSTTFFFLALYITQKKWYNHFIMVMAIFSMSTVGYIGIAIGCISAFWITGKAKVFTLLIASILILVTISIGPYTILKETIFFDKQDISIHETSGRDHLMNATFDCLEKHPLGLGFFAGEPYWLYAKHFSAISAHNSLFSAAIAMGFVGLILMGLYLMGMAKIVFSKYIPIQYRPAMIGIFCVALMHCMGNPAIGSRVFAAWIPVSYAFILICAFYIQGKYFSENE